MQPYPQKCGRYGAYRRLQQGIADVCRGTDRILSYFPREDTLFVLDEPNRLNERMELILYEYTESMKTVWRADVFCRDRPI